MVVNQTSSTGSTSSPQEDRLKPSLPNQRPAEAGTPKPEAVLEPARKRPLPSLFAMRLSRRQLLKLGKDHAFAGVIVLFLLTIGGVWLHQWRLQRRVRAALAVEIPYAVLSGGPRAARPRPAHGPGVSPTPTPAPTPIMNGKDLQLPQELDDLVQNKGLFGATVNGDRVQCVWGDRVLFNNQWFKLNQPHDNIVVRRIELNKVVVEINGQRQVLTVWPKGFK